MPGPAQSQRKTPTDTAAGLSGSFAPRGPFKTAVLEDSALVPDYAGRKLFLVFDPPGHSLGKVSSVLSVQSSALLAAFLKLEAPPELLVLVRRNGPGDTATRYCAKLERANPGIVTARAVPSTFSFWSQDAGKASSCGAFLAHSRDRESDSGLGKALQAIGVGVTPVGGNFEGGNILAGRIRGADVVVVGDSLAKLWLGIKEIRDLDWAEARLAPRLSRFMKFDHLIISRNLTHDDLQIHVDQHLHFPGPDQAFMTGKDLERGGRQRRLARRLEKLGAEIIPLAESEEDFFASRSITNMVSLFAPQPISIVPEWPGLERKDRLRFERNLGLIEGSGRTVIPLEDTAHLHKGNHHCLVGMAG